MHPVGKAVGKQAYFGESTVKIGTNSVEANLAISIKIENLYNLDPAISLRRTILHVRSHKHMVIHYSIGCHGIKLETAQNFH